MKTYKTKSKVFGYKIGLNNDNLYVAVPKKYFENNQTVQVVCDSEVKRFSGDDKIIETTQKDKFNGGMNYTLYYFLWKSFN